MHSWYLDGVPESKDSSGRRMHDTWQESNTDTHSSMQLEREWVVQGGRILGLVTAGKPNEKREEQQMRSQ